MAGRREQKEQKKTKQKRRECDVKEIINGRAFLKEKERKTSKPAANTARNKKAMVIAFLFRCCKTAQMRHTKYAVFAQFYIQGE